MPVYDEFEFNGHHEQPHFEIKKIMLKLLIFFYCFNSIA